MRRVTGMQDRCQGVLIGLAAGDRNGGPIRMAVRLAESLLERNGFDPADVVERYLRWWDSLSLSSSIRLEGLRYGGQATGTHARYLRRASSPTAG